MKQPLDFGTKSPAGEGSIDEYQTIFTLQITAGSNTAALVLVNKSLLSLVEIK